MNNSSSASSRLPPQLSLQVLSLPILQGSTRLGLAPQLTPRRRGREVGDRRQKLKNKRPDWPQSSGVSTGGSVGQIRPSRQAQFSRRIFGRYREPSQVLANDLTHFLQCHSLDWHAISEATVVIAAPGFLLLWSPLSEALAELYLTVVHRR